ncbi:MAG: hypothetical protein ABSD57_11325, partial [Verrucomicrobiota bacterium]
MAAAICAGCFFKEVVLVCALLALFASHWKWGKRILMFGGIVLVYVLGRKFLLSQLLLGVADLSMGKSVFAPPILMENLVGNLKALFSPTLNSILFANAGTLAAVLVLGWRKRFLPYMAVLLAFLAVLVLCAVSPGIAEVRDFMEILPLSLILLSERWLEYAESGATSQWSAGLTPAWAVRKTFPVLLPMTIMLIALSTGVAARQYYIIFEDLQPDHLAQSELGKYTIGSQGLITVQESRRKKKADAELELALTFLAKQQLSDAANHFQRVLELDTNSYPALNNLAVLRAMAPDPSLRNGNEAVRLAERACQQTQYKEVVPIRTLAAAYAEAGRFDDAVVTIQKVRAMALAQGQDEFAALDEQLLALFKSGRA